MCARYLKYSAPPRGETTRWRRTFFQDVERYGLPLSPGQVRWGSDIARRQGAKKFDVLFVCLFVTRLNNEVCERDVTMKALEYGNDLDIVG